MFRNLERMREVLLASVLLASLPAGAASEAPASRGRVMVDFASTSPADAWFARALEEKLLQELSRFQRVALLERPADPPACPGREPRCLVDAYAPGADVVVLGTLRGDRLDYEVHETWSRSLAASGSLSLGKGMTGGRLQHQMGSIVRPIVQSGGLLDQRPAPPAPPASAEAVPDAGTPAEVDEGPPPGQQVLVALLVITALPLLIGFLLGGMTLLQRRRSAVWIPGLVLGGLLLLIVFTMTPAWRELVSALRGSTGRPAAALGLNLLGGALWAAFALLNLSVALPPLHGIGRIRPDALWPVVRAWAFTAALRSTLLLLHAPLVLGVLAAGRSAGLGSRLTWTLAVPAAGLFACFWVLALVDVLSAYLDGQLVQGAATSRNRWHPAIRRYLRSYLRRTGADLSPHLLDRILFLPGRGPAAGTYGGGFTRPRVVISQKLLELALGELQELPDPRERTVHFDELPRGLLFPDLDDDQKPAAAARRRAETSERARRRAPLLPQRGKAQAPRVLGEAATLLGYVAPAPRDVTVPLISSTREDLEVVHSLLTEHYAAFEKDARQDDDEDSDPTHKDFLYGVLLREIGALARREGLLASVRLAIAERWPGVRALGELYLRYLSRAPAVVADAAAALSAGRDHLVQYYFLLRSTDERHLTVRADGPRLHRASRDILNQLAAEEPAGEDRQLFRATLRNRLVSLSRFFYSPLEERHARSFRKTALAVLGAALAVLLSVKAAGAIDYHPMYLERMREQHARAAEANSTGGADGGTP